MESKTYVYFSKTGVGYEMTGDDVIPGMKGFINKDDAYVINYSYSDLSNSMLFFVYEWDNIKRDFKTVFESYRKELILVGMVKHIDNLPIVISKKILEMYVDDTEELELEKNANS
jgi:hypothetical protein